MAGTPTSSAAPCMHWGSFQTRSSLQCCISCQAMWPTLVDKSCTTHHAALLKRDLPFIFDTLHPDLKQRNCLNMILGALPG